MSIVEKLGDTGIVQVARVLQPGEKVTYAEVQRRVGDDVTAMNVAQIMLRLTRKGLLTKMGRGLWLVL